MFKYIQNKGVLLPRGDMDLGKCLIEALRAYIGARVVTLRIAVCYLLDLHRTNPLVSHLNAGQYEVEVPYTGQRYYIIAINTSSKIDCRFIPSGD